MTDVVPSPTSSSWVRLNSIMDCSHSNLENSIRKFQHRKLNLKSSMHTQKVVLFQDAIKRTVYSSVYLQKKLNEVKQEKQIPLQLGEQYLIHVR